jgi:hypothetical protein
MVNAYLHEYLFRTAEYQLKRAETWKECAGRLYDELRVRGVSESVSRSGAGCIELFEALDGWECNPMGYLSEIAHR